MRLDRSNHDLREIKIQRHYIKHAEGSVLVQFGDTKIICTVSHAESVPPFLKNSRQGWLTAEYDMLPCSTHGGVFYNVPPLYFFHVFFIAKQQKISTSMGKNAVFYHTHNIF